MELRYNARFRNVDNDLHEIRIFKDVSNTSGVTTTNIDTTRGNPSLDYRLREQIFASTLRFSFMTDDTTNFDELLSASAKEYRADYYIGGVLKWTGYMVPNQVSRNYHGHTYTYSLKFSDGLGDLKNFKPSLSSSGRQTLLAFVKECLSFTDLELDFAIIDNKTETNSTTNTTPIAECTLMNARWLEIKSGRTVTTDAQKILTNILKSFGLYITQFDNKWYIVNAIEVGSKIYFHNWSDLVQSSTATNSATTNLQNYNYEKNSDYLKKEPIREASLTFENKNIPSNLITTNPDFSTSDVSFWTKTSYPGTLDFQLSVVDEELKIEAEDTTDASGTTIESDNISINQLTNEDRIIVRFDYRLEAITWANPGFDPESNSQAYPKLKVELVQGTDVQTRNTQVFDILRTTKTFEYSFSNVGTGNYKLRISDVNEAEYTAINYRLDNFEVLAITEEGENSNTTFDRFYSLTNTDETSNISEEITFLIGDGIQTNDVGNLKIGTSLTSSWSSYNGTENLSLQELYLTQLLKKNSKYRNELNLSFYEENFNVFSVHRQFLVDSIRYNVEELRIDFNAKHYIYNVKLVEHIDSAINTEETSVVLRQVNGEPISGANSVSEVDPTVPSHVKDITTSDITNWNTADTLQEVTEQGRTTDQGIIIQDSTKTHQVELTVNSDGNVILTAGTDKNFHFSGDVVAFSDLTPPPGTWWDSMPIASTNVLGGVKVGNNLTIDADGTLHANASTSGSGGGPSSDTLQDVTVRGATTDRAVTINNELIVDRTTATTNSPLASLYVKASCSGTVANGFGSALLFQYDRGSGLSDNVGTYLESFIHSGANSANDFHNFRIRIRDNDTVRVALTVQSSSDVVFGRDIEARQFKSNFSGNDTVIRSAQSTISSDNRYGTIAVRGDFQNGYHGIQFADVKHDLMIKDDDKFIGFHHAGEGWSFMIGTGKASSDATYMRTRRHFDGTDNFLIDWRDDWLRLGMYFNGSSWVTSGVGSADGIYLNAMDSAGDGGSGGRVAIRSAQQNKALDVNGRIDLNGYSSPGVWYRNGDTDWFVGPENSPSTSFRWYNGSNLMTLTNTGNLTTSGEMTAFSDRRLKRNIETYELDLEKFEKLRAVSYTRNRETKTGFIAQEVQELFPEFVNEQNDHMKTLSLNYAQMIALATSAIQETRKETQKEIDNLKKANERLRKRILKLEKK